MFRSKSLSNHWWFWSIPLAIVLGLFYLYPIAEVVRLSFTNSRLGREEYVYTLSTYIDVLTDETLMTVLRVTLIFVVGSVVFQLFLGMVTAVLINLELPGSGLVKLSMVCAWVVPGIITGIMWQIVFSSSNWGVFNFLLEMIGIGPLPFMHRPGWAIFSATLANIWRGTGFSGILQYAALKAIPIELYEAARVDGSSGWQSFWHITLPLLKPMLLINVVLITIYTFNTYDSIYALTRGGPGGSTTVISLQAYRAVFTYLHLGRGSVYALIMVVLSIVFTLLYIRAMGAKE